MNDAGRDCCESEDNPPGGVSGTPRNPFASAVSRRRFVRATAAAGATMSLSGCGSGGDGSDTDAAASPDSREAPTVFVFNTGDGTVSVIDPGTDEVVDTVPVDTTASFPANQYGTTPGEEYSILWLNVAGGVRGIDAQSVTQVASVESGFGPNYPNLTPDANHLVVAAGGSLSIAPEGDADHRILRVDADPESDGLGDVTGDLAVGHTGPCDATIDPGGEYAFVPEVANDTLAVVRIDPFEVATRVDAGEPAGGGNVLPFMASAAVDGDVMLVENGEGTLDGATRGSESIWDVSDPENPEETARITREDGLQGLPITSEVTPDGSRGYLFTPDADGVVVVDIEAAEVATTIDLGGNAISGTWGPSREKLYVPVQNRNEVAVIEGETAVARIEAGESPTGATAGAVRPADGTADSIGTNVAPPGRAAGRKMEWTYCPDGYCYCGR